MLLRYILFVLMLLYWVGLFVLTHLPQVPSVGPKMNDKTAHFIAYAVLAASLYLTWVVANPRRRRLGLIVLGLAMAYGAFDEITQPLSGRMCELGDWMADTAGAASALALGTAVRWLVGRTRRAREAETVIARGSVV